jgi:hypothetical protein
LLSLLFFACSRPEPEGRETPTAPVVHTDIATVERFVSLPGVTAVRWMETPAGAPGSRWVPGPTDSVLTAYVELAPDAWPLLERFRPSSPGDASSAQDPLSVAPTFRIDAPLAVLPPQVAKELPREGLKLVVTAPDYDIRPLRHGPRTGDGAWRVGPGLLMFFSTM